MLFICIELLPVLVWPLADPSPLEKERAMDATRHAYRHATLATRDLHNNRPSIHHSSAWLPALRHSPPRTMNTPTILDSTAPDQRGLPERDNQIFMHFLIRPNNVHRSSISKNYTLAYSSNEFASPTMFHPEVYNYTEKYQLPIPWIITNTHKITVNYLIYSIYLYKHKLSDDKYLKWKNTQSGTFHSEI